MVHLKNRSMNEESNMISEEKSNFSSKRSKADKMNQDGTEMSGRNTFAFWTIVWLIFVLTVGNIVLTLTIIGVLRLGRGMDYMELVPEAQSIKFFGSTDLDRIYKKDGIIEGFSDVPLTITGDKSNVEINLIRSNGNTQNKMLMSKNGTYFNGINHFEIKDGATNEVIFTLHKPSYNLESASDNLHAKATSMGKLTSPIDESLMVNNTKGKLLLRGGEGVQMEAQEISLSADQNVQLKTVNGTIYLTANKGVYLNIKKIPIVEENAGIKMENKQYKICVCMPQGKLFRVPISNVNHNAHGACSVYSSKFDPCI